MNTLTIVGTRPEIIRICEWERELLFTGQHYNFEMGQQFLNEIHFPKTIHYLPYNIDHSKIEVLVKEIEKKIIEIGKPDFVIVHGDTRSAFSGAQAAYNLKIKVVHTEAGVRCFLNTVEEGYRKEIDHHADFNFCPVPIAVENLKNEGITKGVYFVGDILYDNFLRERGSWDIVFVTIHRQENIENQERLQSLIDNLKEYEHVVFPIHPHTKECLEKFGIELPRNILNLPPLNHQQTLKYIRDSKLVITDSGGIQREAYWLGTPCKVMRENTEWGYYTTAFGEGNAGEKIKNILEQSLKGE